MAVNWTERELGQFAKLQRGLSYSSDQLKESGAPLINLKSFDKGGGYRPEGLKRYVGPRLLNYLVRGGDLLIANTDLTRDAAIVGAPALAPDFGDSPAFFSMDVSRLDVDAVVVDQRFLFYRMQRHDIRRFMQAHSGGSTVLHLHVQAVPKLRLQLPPLPEQRRIAEILDTLDEAIRKTEQVIAKLQQMKQGLLHDLLTLGIDENGELRDPERHPKQFKDSPLGRIPREWEVLRLGNLIREVGGVIQTGPFGSQLHAHEYLKTGVPVVMPQDITDDAINLANIARISERKATELGRHRLQVNDAVFARRGDLTRCTAIKEEERGWVCGTGCLLVRAPRRVLMTEWLTAIYRHELGQRQVLARAVGSTMVNLNGAILASMHVPVPSAQEQLRFAAELQSLRDRTVTELQELDKLRTLKGGLMDDLLTGRVRVAVPKEAAA